MATNTRPDANSLVVDEKQQLYQRYWAHHLWVYRQVLVWTTRVLTLQDRNILYLVAMYSAANAVVMLLMTIGESPLFLLGLFFLTLSATHIFSVLSNTTNRFKLLSRWDENEAELFKKICRRVAQAHVGILRMNHTLQEYRKNDPKKFYIVGILSAVVLSNIGYLISDFVLLHALVNFILFVPLILHYKLHLHLANQNWSEIKHIISDQMLNRLAVDFQAFLQRFKDSGRITSQRTVPSPVAAGDSTGSASSSSNNNDSTLRARKS